jgi:hypothetical protein
MLQSEQKRTFLHRLAAVWRGGFRGQCDASKELLTLAPQLGFFIAKARPNYVYVPRKRVADKEPPPPVLDRELEAFYEAADKVVSDAATMMRYERLFTIWQALANTKHIIGAAMAEIGVWRGGCSYLMARGRRQFAGADAPLIAIDTFEGHPGYTIDVERDPCQRAGKFATTSRHRAERYLRDFPACEVIQGEVTKVLPTLPDRRYFLVHIDTDIHASTAACLEYFHPRLVSGGILVIDDFGGKTCDGVTRAVHDWLPAMRDCQFWQVRTEQCLVTKLASD